jgi:hypothetical protein
MKLMRVDPRSKQPVTFTSSLQSGSFRFEYQQRIRGGMYSRQTPGGYLVGKSMRIPPVSGFANRSSKITNSMTSLPSMFGNCRPIRGLGPNGCRSSSELVWNMAVSGAVL